MIRTRCWGPWIVFGILVAIAAHVLSWMFVVGVIGSVFLVIPIAAYQLFSVLFEKDLPEEIDPVTHARTSR